MEKNLKWQVKCRNIVSVGNNNNESTDGPNHFAYFFQMFTLTIKTKLSKYLK